MKRLCILAVFCATTFACAVDKNDLEKAIRSLDVATVKQIIATEKFTQREHDRYLDLANQMIHDHKFSVKGSLLNRDIVTSCDKTTLDKSALERRIGIGLTSVGGSKLVTAPMFYVLDHDREKRTVTQVLGTVLFFTGIAFLVKSYYTFNKCLDTELRPKYDDAITIKQIVYTARIEGV